MRVLFAFLPEGEGEGHVFFLLLREKVACRAG
jgi:hypothetical protein